MNVNEGHNTELMQQCSILREYAQYVARVRRFAETTSLDKAVEQAVSECIREGILADFLSRNQAEVINMSIFEYDKELEEKKLRKAEFEAGFAEGSLSTSIETARRMLHSGKFSPEEVADFSGLPLDEVRKLY